MKKLIRPITLLSVITLIFGTIYVSVQQSLRLSANDPQIQLAQDIAAKLDRGDDVTSFGGEGVEIDKSLAPFVNIYTKSGELRSGSGYLDNKIADVPIGVLKASEGKSYHDITWEPKTGVRIASVSVAANDYYVLSGRSLKEVEKREDTTFKLAMLGWVVSVLVLGSAYLLKMRFKTSK